MAHTPEPWRIVDAEVAGGVSGKGIIGPDGSAIAQVYSPFGDVQRGNACLIAAAPKLLEACKAWRAFVDHLTYCPYCDHGTVVCQVAWALLVDASGKGTCAITKAGEGE